MGFLNIFYLQDYFDKVALIFFLILAVIIFTMLLLIGLGILRYKGIQWYHNLDFSIFNEVNDIIIVSDLSGFVYYSNHNYQRIFTYKKGISCYAIIAALPGAGAFVYRLKLAISNNFLFEEKLRVDCSIFGHSIQENPAWYSVSVHPIVQCKQKFLFWRITDIMHVQGNCESVLPNFQEAICQLDKIPVGFLSVNTQGTILYLNQIFAEWFSINLASFGAGKHCFDQLFHDAGINKTWSDLRAQSREHQRLDFSQPYEFTLRLAPDTSREKLLSCFMSVSSLPEDDDVHHIIMVPKRTQEDAKNLPSAISNRLVSYLDKSPFAIAVVDHRGNFICVNNAFSLLMRCTSDLISLYDVIPSRDHARLRYAFQKIATYQNVSDPIDTVSKNDGEHHLRFHVMPVVQDHAGTAQNFAVVSVVEITEQNTFEAEIAQNQKMQAVGQLAGGIAHDFNNVLTAILMSCDLLLNTHRSFDPAYADLINIKNNADRAAALVQQLLAFSRKQTLLPEKIDFTEFLSDIRSLILPLLGNNIQLKIIHGRDLWSVKVDQASFQRIIMNLVINARDAISDTGVVTITTNNITKERSVELNYVDFSAGEYVQLSISDTGSGIPSSVQEKMFEPFFTTKEVGKGTGLGLSMVYGIIKQTGGYIYCDSQEGQGATFHIFLPRYIADPEDEVKHIEEVNKKGQNQDLTGSATVLLVEDEDAVRMGGMKALQMRGYTVLEARSGEDALSVLEDNKGTVDIIVSDVVMPEMDGPTLFQEVRKNYPHIKFIFVSGYTKDTFSKNLPKDAVFGFLSKPFTLKQLALAVKEGLAKK